MVSGNGVRAAYALGTPEGMTLNQGEDGGKKKVGSIHKQRTFPKQTVRLPAAAAEDLVLTQTSLTHAASPSLSFSWDAPGAGGVSHERSCQPAPQGTS